MKSAMPSLQQLLAHMPHQDLRGVATRLQVRQGGQHDKPGWVAAITAGWRSPTQAQAWLTLLSGPARAALDRLCRIGLCPATLFLGEFGPIRQSGPGRRFSPSPWVAPVTVAEELYYLGLLHPVGGRSLRQTHQLCVPDEVAALLSVDRPRPSAPPTTPADDDAGWTLCHDVGQLLVFLHGEWARSLGTLRLTHGRRLTLAQLRQLNPYLLRPEAAPLPRSSRRTRRVRTLLFLAEAAQLHEGGRLTPQGWVWLALPPPLQIDALWRAWQEAAPSLYDHHFVRDEKRAWLPPPWPQPLLRALQLSDSAATAAGWADRVLADPALPPHYWMAHLSTLGGLDEVMELLLAGLLAQFGVVEPLPAAGGDAPTWLVTGFGRWLLGQEGTAPAPPSLQAGRWLTPGDTEEWLVQTGTWCNWQAQATLAAFADRAGAVQVDEQILPSYRLSEASLSRAAALGLGLPALFAALTQLGLTLNSGQTATLHRWHAQGALLQLTPQLLLRTASPQQMAALLQERSLRPLLGEQFSPTAVALRVDEATARQALAQAALFPPLGADGPESTAAANPAQPTAAAARGALWLAGRLYAWVGQHLPLPLPPPFAELDQLLASLPPAQQAVLHAQATHLHESLLNLLDNLPYTPPPHPSDPEQWRQPIRAAIEQGQRLTIIYFSAGRNLTTRRLVEPYWIEEPRGTPYLRAYCHSAGRVLTFRLDRIFDLSPDAITGAPADR